MLVDAHTIQYNIALYYPSKREICVQRSLKYNRDKKPKTNIRVDTRVLYSLDTFVSQAVSLCDEGFVSFTMFLRGGP